MNIGISIHLQSEKESLWINGIKQNAIFLLNVFLKLGHNAYLVNSSPVVAPYKDKITWDINQFPIKDWTSCDAETDILFMVGATFSDDELKYFKSLGPGKKIIKYACGNNYIMDMEAVLFDIDGRYQNYNQEIDECWLIPQHETTCKEYFRMMHNLPQDKVKVVPFIWDPIFIDKISEKLKINNDIKMIEQQLPLYTPGKPNIKKQIATFEPNHNIVKWSMIPLLITEDYLNRGGDLKKLNIFSGSSMIKQQYYVNLIKNTNLFKKDPIRLNFHPRMEVMSALAISTDIVIAHQWENVLNYSYLDALYLQFPLVHNSPYIQDAGYYYPDFNVREGAKQLELAMNLHDKHIDKYNAKSETVLTRYTIYNEEMVDLYGKLLDNLITPDTHEISHRYDWKTNTYL